MPFTKPLETHLCFFSFFLAVLCSVGSYLPDQGLNPVPGSESTESYPAGCSQKHMYFSINKLLFIWGYELGLLGTELGLNKPGPGSHPAGICPLAVKGRLGPSVSTAFSVSSDIPAFVYTLLDLIWFLGLLPLWNLEATTPMAAGWGLCTVHLTGTLQVCAVPSLNIRTWRPWTLGLDGYCRPPI